MALTYDYNTPANSGMVWVSDGEGWWQDTIEQAQAAPVDPRSVAPPAGYEQIGVGDGIAAKQDPAQFAYIREFNYDDNGGVTAGAPYGNAGAWLDTAAREADKSMAAWGDTTDPIAQLAKAFGLTPYDWNVWKTQYNMANFGDPYGDRTRPGSVYDMNAPMLRALAAERGYADNPQVVHYIGELEKYYGQRGDIERARNNAGKTTFGDVLKGAAFALLPAAIGPALLGLSGAGAAGAVGGGLAGEVLSGAGLSTLRGGLSIGGSVLNALDNPDKVAQPVYTKAPARTASANVAPETSSLSQAVMSPQPSASPSGGDATSSSSSLSDSVVDIAPTGSTSTPSAASRRPKVIRLTPGFMRGAR